MSVSIIHGGAISDSAGIAADTYHGAGTDQTYASNGLGIWMLQRSPEQQGRWYFQLYIRGLCICGYAVQDDFGNLQAVSV